MRASLEEYLRAILHHDDCEGSVLRRVSRVFAGWCNTVVGPLIFFETPENPTRVVLAGIRLSDGSYLEVRVEERFEGIPCAGNREKCWPREKPIGALFDDGSKLRWPPLLQGVDSSSPQP